MPILAYHIAEFRSSLSQMLPEYIVVVVAHIDNSGKKGLKNLQKTQLTMLTKKIET